MNGTYSYYKLAACLGVTIHGFDFTVLSSTQGIGTSVVLIYANNAEKNYDKDDLGGRMAGMYSLECFVNAARVI